MCSYQSVIGLFFLIGVSVQEDFSYDGYKGVSVRGDLGVLQKFRKSFEGVKGVLLLEELNEEDNYIVSPELAKAFEEAVKAYQLATEVVFNNISQIIQEEVKNTRRAGIRFSWDTYYDVDGIYGYLYKMQKTYPDSTKLVIGGKSYEGRDILGIRIINPYEEDAGKPAIFIESGIHAREWITPAATTYFINQLLTSEDPQIQHLRDTYDWHIFPTVNPDGYHYTHTVNRFWRKTRSESENGCFGADPNRNWDHNWNEFGSSSDPCDPQVYSGKKAFSEIETRTLSKYISEIQNLLGYIGIHSDAQMLLLPYSDSKEHTENYDDLVKIGKTSLAYGQKVNGAKYKGPATAAEILYAVSGGSMDWVREALGTPLVYTYELRGRMFHWPPARIPEQGEELTQMILGLTVEAEAMDYFKIGRRIH